MKNKYVKVNDIMELINTSNRGTCDYFIVDQIEKLCKSEKVYDVDKVVEQLEEVEKIMTSPVNQDCFGEECRASDCTVCLISKAIEIVKGGGVNVN